MPFRLFIMVLICFLRNFFLFIGCWANDLENYVRYAWCQNKYSRSSCDRKTDRIFRFVWRTSEERIRFKWLIIIRSNTAVAVARKLLRKVCRRPVFSGFIFDHFHWSWVRVHWLLHVSFVFIEVGMWTKVLAFYNTLPIRKLIIANKRAPIKQNWVE